MQHAPYIVVIGLGKTGLSCIRFLSAQGYQIVAMDTRTAPPGLSEVRACYPNVAIKLGALDTKLLDNAFEIIVSPGIALSTPAIAGSIKKGVRVCGDIELFLREAQAPVVVITGSNGKSTVTSLVGEMGRSAGLKVKVGGNLGVPALDLLRADSPDYYILELSSFQLETTPSLASHCAVCLNISPDHMDRYETLDDYVHAKHHVYQQCQTAVINVDDPRSYPEAVLPESVFRFGKSDADFYLRKQAGQWYLAAGDELLLATQDMGMKGQHQYLNALAALAIGTACDFPKEAMLNALRRFRGLPHRCQLVAVKNDVAWINDSKATNVGAACAALEGVAVDMAGKVVLLAGGLNKQSDFSPLQPLVRRYVRSAVLFGQDRADLASALQDDVAVVEVDNLADAVKYAQEIAQPGDVVLLAPACASFDQFTNFEARGNAFVAAVKEMA